MDKKEQQRTYMREYMSKYRNSEKGKDKIKAANLNYWKRKILEEATLTDEQKKIIEGIM